MRLFLTLVAVGLVFPVLASAQPQSTPSPEELAEARALFVTGTEAVEEGRWSDAVDRFSRAYELSGVPPALFNVAFALRALGRHVEARNAFRKLLARHSDDLDPEMRRQAQRLLAEVTERVAQISVNGLEADMRYEVRLDGGAVDDSGERPLRLETDAGRHSIRAVTEGYRPFLWEGQLIDGQKVSVDAFFEPLPKPDSRTVFQRPAFWIITGALLIGGGVATGIILQKKAQLEPNSDRSLRVDRR